MCYVCLSKYLKRQGINSQNISHEKMECAQRIWITYIVCVCVCVLFLIGERHLILGTAKKGILTLKYGPKDILL